MLPGKRNMTGCDPMAFVIPTCRMYSSVPRAFHFPSMQRNTSLIDTQRWPPKVATPHPAPDPGLQGPVVQRVTCAGAARKIRYAGYGIVLHEPGKLAPYSCREQKRPGSSPDLFVAGGAPGSASPSLNSERGTEGVEVNLMPILMGFPIRNAHRFLYDDHCVGNKNIIKVLWGCL
jgi:hypothetical protein